MEQVVTMPTNASELTPYLLIAFAVSYALSIAFPRLKPFFERLSTAFGSKTGIQPVPVVTGTNQTTSNEPREAITFESICAIGQIAAARYSWLGRHAAITRLLSEVIDVVDRKLPPIQPPAPPATDTPTL